MDRHIAAAMDNFRTMPSPVIQESNADALILIVLIVAVGIVFMRPPQFLKTKDGTDKLDKKKCIPLLIVFSLLAYTLLYRTSSD